MENTLVRYEPKRDFGKKCRKLLGSIVFCLALLLIALLAVPIFALAALMGGVWNAADKIINILE